jgi:putative ABC transport system permease protein
VSAGTVLTAVVLGVVAVALAPLLTVRRLRRMDIPGTLRVVE